MVAGDTASSILARAAAEVVVMLNETAAERDRLREVNAELLTALKSVLGDLDDVSKLDPSGDFAAEMSGSVARARAAIAAAEKG